MHLATNAVLKGSARPAITHSGGIRKIDGVDFSRAFEYLGLHSRKDS